ncbi:conserved hypothetical protein [Ricinus communis]|uniref:Uncharacterized protein n=1 Tax=Ricinus communis TaxID=3988 RepID=B9STV9_RICCO|nr:conserved hypothetical protein [Ricinus communis]
MIVTDNSFALMANATATRIEGGNGGAPSECDDKYHDNSELVVALIVRFGLAILILLDLYAKG